MKKIAVTLLALVMLGLLGHFATTLHMVCTYPTSGLYVKNEQKRLPISATQTYQVWV
ncbi:hypothetical protein [Rheinheimera fenheensis]|uniref:hypothetical protein n=1 Tax=Rheinheimera fenheensis TaxID=3152295 RepID=UPI00325FF72F